MDSYQDHLKSHQHYPQSLDDKHYTRTNGGGRRPIDPQDIEESRFMARMMDCSLCTDALPGTNLKAAVLEMRFESGFPMHIAGDMQTDGTRFMQGAEQMQERMLKWFECDHLTEELRAISEPFQALAIAISHTIDGGPERTIALRKLLEAKDAAVRAKLHPGG